MPGSSQAGLAAKSLVDDRPGAARVGARLNGILQKIDAGETLSSSAQAFLTSGGRNALLALATGQIDRPALEEAAARERTDRIQRAKDEADRVADEEARKAEATDAAVNAIDQDLRALLIRSGPDARDRIRNYPLEQDPERFAWLRNWNHKAAAARRR